VNAKTVGGLAKPLISGPQKSVRIDQDGSDQVGVNQANGPGHTNGPRWSGGLPPRNEVVAIEYLDEYESLKFQSEKFSHPASFFWPRPYIPVA
jgi:hypothetical protein